MTWTDAMLARLTKLQTNQDLSYGKIAAKLSAEFRVRLTKNACIGMARRLDLPQRRTVAGAPKARRPRQPAAIEPEEKIVPVPCWPVTVPEPVEGKITIYDLTDKKCHYPFGDRPPYAYCGKPTAFGSWCRHHGRIVYPRGVVR